MVCIFAFYEEAFSVGWRLVNKSESLDPVDLKFFIRCFGKENLRIRCGDYDFAPENF